MKDQNTEAEMGFFEHVEALRWHIIRSVIAIIVGAIIVGFNYDFFFNEVLLGICSKDFPTYRIMCNIGEHLNLKEAICIDKDIPLDLQNLALFGQVTMLFQYCLIFGIVIAFPYILFELWRFVAPALSESSQRKTSLVILFCSFFFFTGVVFCYFVIIPFSVNFAVNFTLSPKIHNQFTIDNYIDFFTVMLLGMGLVFEMPMIVFFLAKLGILSAETMRNFRRYAIVVILILAGILTPSPDIFTQCLVAVPLYLLFEISIIIAAVIEKRNVKDLTS